jgi:hypothetical protein
VAAVRADAEKRLVAESMRLRAESEQAFAAERRRAEAHLEADHRKAEQQLRETLAAGEAERQKLERDAHSPPDADVDSGSILAAARAIGSARTLADALALLVRSAAAQAPRVALFILNGDHFDEWSVDGIPALSHETIDLDRGGLLRAAITHGGRVSSAAGDPDRTPPACAKLPDGRAAAAVPLMLGGQAVGVLYADEGVSTTGQPIRGWAASVELLTSHAAACLASLTAVKALQVLEAGNGHGSAAEATPGGDEQSAKRYAKLLVSEIKLYNEGAVRVGREKRDLLHRLRAEIERSRRLYEERVPPSVTARASYFQQELIHTLAGGDPALLGS